MKAKKTLTYFFTVNLLLLSGCTSYKIKTESFLCFPSDNDPNAFEKKRQALEHPLYQIIPRHRCQIKWYDIGHWITWTLFGNDDDGIFGEESTAKYRSHKKPSLSKALAWAARNPLHNFCFYVIGSAYRENSEITLISIAPPRARALTYRRQGHIVFAGKRTSFFLGLHGGKPFISLRLAYTQTIQSDFYIGWRCRGNFGIKCIFLKTRSKSLIE